MSKTVVVPSRLSYAVIWEAKKDQNGVGKYSAMLLIPKSDQKTIKAVEEGIDAARKEKFGEKASKSIAGTFYDGDSDKYDDPKYAACRGHMVLNVNTNDKQPLSIMKRKNGVYEQITDRSQVYSGCWCQVEVNFVAYDKEVAGARKKGVSSYLGRIVKWKNDERLGESRASVEEVFADGFDSEDDDNGEFEDV